MMGVGGGRWVWGAPLKLVLRVLLGPIKPPIGRATKQLYLGTVERVMLEILGGSVGRVIRKDEALIVVSVKYVRLEFKSRGE
jgi:hypothetical protein